MEIGWQFGIGAGVGVFFVVTILRAVFYGMRLQRDRALDEAAALHATRVLNSPEAQEQRFLEYMGVANFKGIFGMPEAGDTTLGIEAEREPDLETPDGREEEELELDIECRIRPSFWQRVARFLPWRIWRRRRQILSDAPGGDGPQSLTAALRADEEMMDFEDRP